MSPTATARAAAGDEPTHGRPDAGAVKPATGADRLRIVEDPEGRMSELTQDAPTVWRNGSFEADDWTFAGADDAVGDGPAVLSLERFLAEHEALAARNAPLGVVVEAGEPLDDLIPHLSRVTLVALPFPKYADGRSMSTARLLRERHGFAGEVRATGEVLIDQMPLMRRCGFDAYTVTNPVTRKQLEAGLWPEVPFYMQPVGSAQRPEAPAGARPWARKPA